MKKCWKINTSNRGKLEEFQQLFSRHGCDVSATNLDLQEIKADPLTVIIHKASLIGEEILVEDTSMDIEGADIGINVRWMLDHLASYTGRKAIWRVLLAYQKKSLVYVYEGIVSGTIVQARGTAGFGFDAVFLPEGHNLTLAQAKPDTVNARAIAIQALLENRPIGTFPLLTNWQGAWQ